MAHILHYGFVILIIKELEPCEILFKVPFTEAKEREDGVGSIAALRALGMSHQKALNVLNPYTYIYPFWSFVLLYIFPLYGLNFAFVEGYSQKKKSFKFFFNEYMHENTILIFSYLSPQSIAIITLVQSLYGGQKNLCTKVLICQTV